MGPAVINIIIDKSFGFGLELSWRNNLVIIEMAIPFLSLAIIFKKGKVYKILSEYKVVKKIFKIKQHRISA